MPDFSRTITDPFNHLVYITGDICMEEAEKELFFEDVCIVISRPAICIMGMQEDSGMIYYYRSTDWHHTMLITAKFLNNRWQTTACERDPTTERLSIILKSGRQLI